MTVDEKGLREAMALAIQNAMGLHLTVGEDGEINGAGRASYAAADRITAYLSARSAEPVAWRYELASAVKHHPDGSKTGENWKWHLTDFAPNVPDWGIRNLTPLYAHPTPEPSDA